MEMTDCPYSPWACSGWELIFKVGRTFNTVQDLQAPEIRTEWLWCAWCPAKHLANRQHCQSEKPLAMVKTLHFPWWKWSLHFVNLPISYGDDFILNICLRHLKIGMLAGPELINIWQNLSVSYQFQFSLLFYWIRPTENFLFCSQQVLGFLPHYWYYKWKVIRKPGLQKNMQFSTLFCLWKPSQQAQTTIRQLYPWLSL